MAPGFFCSDVICLRGQSMAEVDACPGAEEGPAGREVGGCGLASAFTLGVGGGPGGPSPRALQGHHALPLPLPGPSGGGGVCLLPPGGCPGVVCLRLEGTQVEEEQV